MDDHKLNEMLRSFKTVEPPPAAMDRAWEKARLAYTHRDIHHAPEKPRWWRQSWMIFAMGAAAASVVVVALLPSLQHQDPAMVTQKGNGQDFQTLVSQQQEDLQSLQNLFPQRLKAVVRSEQGTQYVLAEEGDKPIAKNPVFLEITKDGAKTQITTFSGETIQFDSSDEGSKMEVMMTPDGKVLIVGPNFVWKSDSRQPLQVPGSHEVLNIKAKPLQGI